MIHFSRQSQGSRRLALALLAGLLLVAIPAAGPALGAASRITTHFRATFNHLQGDSTTPMALEAEIGTFETSSLDVFTVEYGQAGNGYLLVNDKTGVGESLLRCVLDPAVQGAAKVNAAVQVTPDSEDGQLNLRASDDGNTPMIDVEWTRGGEILVNDVPAMHYHMGTTYLVTLNFTNPLIGPTTLSTKIEGSDGSQVEVNTVLGGNGLDFGFIDVLVPSSGSWGQFVIDEIRVVSSNSVTQSLGLSY